MKPVARIAHGTERPKVPHQPEPYAGTVAMQRAHVLRPPSVGRRKGRRAKRHAASLAGHAACGHFQLLLVSGLQDSDGWQD